MNFLALGIDPATTVSGYAIMSMIEGKISHVVSGESDGYTRADRDAIAFGFIAHAEKNALRMMVAMETWSLHGKWSNAAKVSVCESGGRWKETLEFAGIGHKCQRCKVDEWRREVLMERRRIKTPEWKSLAIAHAETATGFKPRENQSEAICIALWALKQVTT